MSELGLMFKATRAKSFCQSSLLVAAICAVIGMKKLTATPPSGQDRGDSLKVMFRMILARMRRLRAWGISPVLKA